MIQGIVSRMASNSFLLKGWTVTIIVGLLAFANVIDIDSKYIFIAFIPALFFWFLDGFFIRQERLFIKLYEHVTILENNEINFSMKTDKFQKDAGSWFKAVTSKTLLIFYLPIIGVILIALINFP